MSTVWIIASGKGGVGKSTITARTVKWINADLRLSLITTSLISVHSDSASVLLYYSLRSDRERSPAE